MLLILRGHKQLTLARVVRQAISNLELPLSCRLLALIASLRVRRLTRPLNASSFCGPVTMMLSGRAGTGANSFANTGSDGKGLLLLSILCSHQCQI